MLRTTLLIAAAWLAMPTIDLAAADEWGNLSLRLVYDGEPPKPKILHLDKDQAVCKQGDLVDESLLVNKENRGIANVVVWLVPQGDPAPSVHPDYEKTAKAEVTLAVKNCRYEPHVTLVRTTQTLVLRFLDPIGHSVRSELPDGRLDVLPGAAAHKQAFTKGASAPGRIECNIHPWMSGVLFVHNDPYMAASDASGRVKLANVPVGKWQFRVWHQRCGFINKAALGGKAVDWPRGKIEWEIKPGANDLGDVLVKPAMLKEKE